MINLPERKKKKKKNAKGEKIDDAELTCKRATKQSSMRLVKHAKKHPHSFRGSSSETITPACRNIVPGTDLPRPAYRQD